MNYEQKYKQALEKLQEALAPCEDGCKISGLTRGCIENIFPELKESEGERIKREILELVSIAGNGNQFEEIKDWLEKQGEPNPADKVKPKFHVGDWISGYYTNYKVLSVNNEGYLVEDTDGDKINILFENEKFHHIFTIADAKDGDLIYVSTELKGIQAIFHKFENGIIYFHCNLCNDFTQGGYEPSGDVECVYPLQKTHYQRFFQKMKEAGYEWNSDKKELKKVEVASKENNDERIRKEIIDFFRLPHPQFVGERDQEEWLAWIEKQGNFKMVDASKVIEWLNDQACLGWIEDVEVDKFIDKFKKDFGL